MQKYIIVSVNEDFIIAIAPDGNYHTLKKRPYHTVGDSVYVDTKKTVVFASVVLFFLFVLISTIFGIGYSFKNTPVSYISIDINPGVEFTTNRYNKVVSVNATNEVAKTLIANEDFIGKPITECAEKIASLALSTGYFNTEIPVADDIQKCNVNAMMVMAVNEEDNVSQSIVDSIVDKLEDLFTEKAVFCAILTKKAEKESADLANELGVSVGKAELLRATFLTDAECEVYKDYSVKQLNAKMKNQQRAQFSVFQKNKQRYVNIKTQMLSENLNAYVNYQQSITPIFAMNFKNTFKDLNKDVKKHSPNLVSDWSIYSQSWCKTQSMS